MNDSPVEPGTAPARTPGADPAPGDGRGHIGPQLRFVVAGLVSLSLFLATYLVLVTTDAGQRLENLALRGAELRDGGDQQAAQELLSFVTVAVFVLAVAVVFTTGLVLRRPGLGSVAAAIMVLSVAAAELVKELIGRPVLAPGPVWILRNSFPSGTATAATSIAVGAFLVAPQRLRWLVLPTAALFAALVANAVQASGWHRLSDTIGSTMLVLGVAFLGVAWMARAGLVQRSEGGRIDRRVTRLLTVVSAGTLLVAIMLLALPTAFPLLAAPDGARRAFLQAAFPLVGAGVTLFSLTVFGLLVQPFAMGRGTERPNGRGRRLHREETGSGAGESAVHEPSDRPTGPAAARVQDTSVERRGRRRGR